MALLLLWLVDALFIGVHLAFVELSVAYSNPLSIEMDRGYPEFFQYLKWGFAVLCLAWLCHRERDLVYVSWTAAILYIFLDEILMLHEQFGRSLGKSDLARDINSWLVADHPDYVLGLQDLGELAAFGVLGLLAVLHLSASYGLSKSCSARFFTIRLLLWIAVFAFFSVVLDMVHAISRSYKFAFGVIEDGGEMLTASVLVAMLLAAVLSQPEGERTARKSGGFATPGDRAPLGQDDRAISGLRKPQA
jgi:hypothetical protein